MQYKRIVLELLQQYPQIYDQLLQNRTLLPTLNLYASQLRDSHQSWKLQLLQARPGSNPTQIASEAMELAIRDLQDSLAIGSPTEADETLSLDQAMAFIRQHTPPA